MSLGSLVGSADILKYFVRLKETWKGRHYVKKLLNGGGSLSAELIKDAIELFPRAKLLSAYGIRLVYLRCLLQYNLLACYLLFGIHILMKHCRCEFDFEMLISNV